MKENITSCLWFNGQARAAADLYCSAFPDTRVTSQSPIVTGISIGGHSITLLDGGPMYKPNPSISLQYHCEDAKTFDKIWNTLHSGGSIIADRRIEGHTRFGWITDKYGISWQLNLEEGTQPRQRITSCLVFSGAQQGKAAEAVKHYNSVFKNAVKPSLPSADMHVITLLGQELALMDYPGKKGWEFSEGVSLTIHCNTQDEIDYYWTRLTEGGEESMCGWLKDRFGVSWQVIPVALSAIMNDPAKAQKAAKAFMAMRKLNIEQIVQASLGY